MDLEDLMYEYSIWLAEKGYVEPLVPDAREAVNEFLAWFLPGLF